MAEELEWELPTEEELVLGQQKLGANNLPIEKEVIDIPKPSKSGKEFTWDLDIDPRELFVSPYEAARLGGSGNAFGPNYFDQFDFTPKIGGDNELLRAQRQEWYKQFANFANQAILGEIAGGIIEGVGYLLDFAMMGDLAKGEEREFGNFLSETGKGIKEWTKEVSPIYEEEPGKYRPGDPGWWFKNGVSIASTLSLMIPAAGGARALALAGRALGATSKIGKFANAASKLARGRAISAQTVQASKWLGYGVTQAVLSRHMESLMESSQVFDQNLERYLAEGLSEKDAREAAAEGAADVYRRNWWMLLTDVPQYLMLGAKFIPGRGKTAKAVNEAAGKKITRVPLGLGRGARFLTGMGLEGFEEGYQHVISEEGTYVSDLMIGLTEESAFNDRLDEYLQDDNLWTAVTFGAIGGGIFQAILPKVQDLLRKQRGETTQEDAINEKVTVIKELLPALAAANRRVKEADATGNLQAMHDARFYLNMLAAVKAEATGTTEQHLELLNHLRNMSEEDIEAWNKENPDNVFDKAFIEEIVPQLIEATNEISKIYKAEKRQYGASIALQTTQELYKITQYGRDIEKYEAVVAEIEKTYIPQKENLSTVGSQIYDVAVEIKKLRHTQKQIEFQIENNLLNPQSVGVWNEHLDAIREAIPKLIEQRKKLDKEERTKEEKLEDNRIIGMIDSIDPLGQNAAQVEILKTQIDNAQQRLKRLRDTKKRTATVDQISGERAWTTNQVEEKLRGYQKGALLEARNGTRVGSGNDVVMIVAGKPIPGTIAYNVGKPDVEKTSTLKKAPIGYIFKSHDGKIIQVITGDNVDNLHIVNQKELDAIKDEQKRREVETNRILAIQEVHESLITRLGEIQKEIQNNRWKIEQNRNKLAALAQELQVIDRTTPGRKRIEGLKPQEWKAKFRFEVEFQIALIEETIEKLDISKRDLINKRNTLEGELRTLRQVHYHPEALLGKKLATEAAGEIEYLKNFQHIVSPESLKEGIVAADFYIGEIEKEISDLTTHLELLKDFYVPIELAELIINRDIYVDWFQQKYPNHPNKKDILANLDSKKSHSHLISYLKTNPDFLTDLKKLVLLETGTQKTKKEQKEIYDDILATRNSLIHARKNLRLAKERIETEKQFYNRWIVAEDILSLYQQIGDAYARRQFAIEQQKEQQDKDSSSQETTKFQNVPPVVFQYQDPELAALNEKELEPRKESLSTTSGQHIIYDDTEDSGEITKRELQQRWFWTLAKLPRITSEYGYYLQIINFDYAEKNNLEEAYDEEDKREDTETSLKVVLVDSEGNLIRADDKGNLDPKGKILATYLHVSPFFKRLSPQRVLKLYLGQVKKIDDKAIEGLLDNKDKGITIGRDHYKYTELVDEAELFYTQKHNAFREKALNLVQAGEKVYVPIVNKSAGIPRTEGPDITYDEGGNKIEVKKTYGLSRFAALKDIAAFHVPISNVLTLATNSTDQRHVYPGQVYIEDRKGRVIKGINRKLNEKEVDLILNLLQYASQGSKFFEVTRQYKTKTGELKTNTFHILPKNLSKTKAIEDSRLLIPNLVYWGHINEENTRKKLEEEGLNEEQIDIEINKRKDYQMFFNFKKQRIHFGFNPKTGSSYTLPLSEIANVNHNATLREWLLNRYHQVNRRNLTAIDPDRYYSHPISFKVVNGKGIIETKTYWPERAEPVGTEKQGKALLAGYETFLYKELLKTDLVSNDEVQLASSYFTYQYDISSSPRGVKVEEEEVEEGEERERVPYEIKTIQDILNRKAGDDFEIAFTEDAHTEWESIKEGEEFKIAGVIESDKGKNNFIPTNVFRDGKSETARGDHFKYIELVNKILRGWYAYKTLKEGETLNEAFSWAFGEIQKAADVVHRGEVDKLTLEDILEHSSLRISSIKIVPPAVEKEEVKEEVKEEPTVPAEVKPTIDLSREWKDDLESRLVYSKAGINTMRTKAAKENEHFGNPWSEGKYKGTIKTDSIPEAVQNYKDWLLGTAHQDVKPSQRQWILDQINQGKLDGATLLYAGKLAARGQGMHPTALAEVVEEVREEPAAPEVATPDIPANILKLFEENEEFARAVYTAAGLQGEVTLKEVEEIDFTKLDPKLLKELREKLESKYKGKVTLEYTNTPIPENPDPDIQNQRVGGVNWFMGDTQTQWQLRGKLLGPIERAMAAQLVFSQKDKILINSTMHLLIEKNPLKYLRVNQNNTVSIRIETLASDMVEELGEKIIPEEFFKEAQDFADRLNDPKNYEEDFKKNRKSQEIEIAEGKILLKELQKQLQEQSAAALFTTLIETNTNRPEQLAHKFMYPRQYEDPSGSASVSLKYNRHTFLDALYVPRTFRLTGASGNEYQYSYVNGKEKPRKTYPISENVTPEELEKMRIIGGERVVDGFIYKVERREKGKVIEEGRLVLREENEDEWLEARAALKKFKEDPEKIKGAIEKILVEQIENTLKREIAFYNAPNFKELFIEGAVQNAYELTGGWSGEDMVKGSFENSLRDNLRANNITGDRGVLATPFGISPDKLLELSNNREYKELKKRKKKIEYILNNKDKFKDAEGLSSWGEGYQDASEMLGGEVGLLAPVPGWFVNAHSVSLNGKYIREITGFMADFSKGLVYMSAQESYDRFHDNGILPRFQEIVNTKNLNTLLPTRLIYNKAIDLSNAFALLNQKSQDTIVGQANIKAGTVLIHRAKQRSDTLPHEYAHHYIRWFRDTAMVQEGIKRFGSEEELVQQIGEQATRQKGEAWNWWKKFTRWILDLLSDREILQILTDSFLENVDINKQFGVTQSLTASQRQKAQSQYATYRKEASEVGVKIGTQKDIEGFESFIVLKPVPAATNIGEALSQGLTEEQKRKADEQNQTLNQTVADENSEKKCNPRMWYKRKGEKFFTDFV